MRTVIVVNDAPQSAAFQYEGAVVVATPLDLIRQLEDRPELISKVVLLGSRARHGQLAAFLLDSYPSVRVVDVYTSNPV